jgi:predicted amidohydrolase
MKRALDACSALPLPDVAVLPELFTVGFKLDSISGAALHPEELDTLPLAKLAGELGIWLIGGSHPVRTSRGIINSMPVYDPSGNRVHTAEKIHLFRRMGEDSVFAGGLPSGVFRMGDVVAGAAVCYDLRFPEVFRPLVLKGARILFVSAQWPIPRRKVFRYLLQARSAEAQVFTVGCNLGGDHLGSRFRGGGGIANPWGVFLKGETVMPGVRDFRLELKQVDEERSRINCLADRRPSVYTMCEGGEE